MANSARRIVDSVQTMAWLPTQLMSETLGNAATWGQVVKQFVLMRCGVETKRQQEMTKGQREDFIMDEYANWVGLVKKKHPNAAVNAWLDFTTGTRTQKVHGHYLYRNFQQGLRIFHNQFNPLWESVIKAGTSGKSKEELWERFCYLWHCVKVKRTPLDSTPDDFDVRKAELKKWVYAYKYTGPPCELLDIGEGECHEELSSPKNVAARPTGTKQRKSKKTFEARPPGSQGAPHASRHDQGSGDQETSQRP
jgi:hypothetical protein